MAQVVADITAFAVTYKDVMAPMGYSRVTNVEGVSCITKNVEGAYDTFLWSQHGDAERRVSHIDLCFDDQPPPPGFSKLGETLLGGHERRCYLCYKLTAAEGNEQASSGADGEGKGQAPLLPLCGLKIAFAAAHDLAGEGYEKLDKNILDGLGGEAYIHFRRRRPGDRLKWNAKRLELGDLLDAKDTVNNWCFAMVIGVDADLHPGEIKIHYTRWEGERWDEWISTSSARLAEYGTKSREETSIKQGTLWNTSVDALTAKMEKLALVSGNPHKLDEFLEKQCSVFVARCLGYNCEPKAEVVPMIYELLKCLVGVFVSQLAGDTPVNRKLLQLCVQVLYADPSVSFYFLHEGYKASSGIMGFMSSSPDIVEDAPEETYVRTRGRQGQGDSKYYGALINYFGEQGGFDAILRRLEAPVGDRLRMSLDELRDVVCILAKPSKWYASRFQDDFFPRFQQAIFQRMSNLSNKELSTLDQDVLNAILEKVEKLLLDTIEDFSGDEMLEKFQLQLSRTLLTCPYLNKRLLGVEILLEWIQRVERKEKASQKGGVSDDDDDDGLDRGGGTGHVYGAAYRHGQAVARPPALPAAKWLDANTLAEWLTKQRLLEIVLKGTEHMVGAGAGGGAEEKHGGGAGKESKSPGSSSGGNDGVDSHPSIIQKAMSTRKGTTSLLQFLAKQQNAGGNTLDTPGSCLTKGLLEMVWESALSPNQMESESCVEGMAQSAKDFSPEVFVFFNDKIESFPANRATEKWVSMFGSYAEMALKDEEAALQGASKTDKKKRGKSTPRKGSASSVANSGIVLDKLFEIVFAAEGIRIEADAIAAAKTSLATALRRSSRKLQQYVQRMIDTLEKGTYVEESISMISNLLPLLGGSGAAPTAAAAATNGESKESGGKSAGTNGSEPSATEARLKILSKTIVGLVVQPSTNSARAQSLLAFMREIMTHAHLKLGLDDIRSMWGPLVVSSSPDPSTSSPLSRSVFLKWLKSCLKDKFVQADSLKGLFDELVVPRMRTPGTGQDTVPLFACFQLLFDAINTEAGKLVDGRQAISLDLYGIDALWAFLAADTPASALNNCVDRLIRIVLGMHKSAYGGDKQQVSTITVFVCPPLPLSLLRRSHASCSWVSPCAVVT